MQVALKFHLSDKFLNSRVLNLSNKLIRQCMTIVWGLAQLVASLLQPARQAIDLTGS
jgi:hypothetical protein